MAINLKFTKFDNTPWGFRLAGGSDFPQPLTVIKVLEGSLAECMGLQVGDVVVRLNDEPVSSMTHGQAHEALMRAGNNFALGVQRVNFKKLRPRIPVLKESKVVEELQYIATEAPPRVQELKRTSTFLQKPQRPVPEPKKKEESQEDSSEQYRVVIKKQQRRSITDRLLERGLLKPGEPSPEPPTPEVKMASTEMELQIKEEMSFCLPDTLENLIESSPPLESSETSLEASKTSLEAPDTSLKAPEASLEVPEAPLEAPEAPLEAPEASLEAPEAPLEAPETSLDLDISLIKSPLDYSKENSSPNAPRASKNKEIAVPSSRRAPNKRKSRLLYTRGHYFRRCIFGNHGDAKRSNKVRGSPKGRSEENTALISPLVSQDRRGSLDTSVNLRIKGRYLENYLKRRDSWPRRVLEGFLQQSNNLNLERLEKESSCTKRTSSWRTRYAEQIVKRALKFVIAFSGLEPLLRRPVMKSQSRQRRFHLKGRYFEHALAKDFTRISNRVKEILLAADAQAKVNRKCYRISKIKGHYVERCLERQSIRIASSIVNFLGITSPQQQQILRHHHTADTLIRKSSKRRISFKAHYGERIFGRYLSSFGHAADYVCSSILPAVLNSSEIINHTASVSSSPFASSPDVTSLTFDQLERIEDKIDDKSGLIGKFLQSSGDFVSTEIFHRGSRRLSRSYKSKKHFESSGWLDSLRKSYLNCFSRRPVEEESPVCLEKDIPDVDREGRRLSFVPTILYEGLTNRIGIDFTRLVAYAFVPCTSVILLYMYK